MRLAYPLLLVIGANSALSKSLVATHHLEDATHNRQIPLMPVVPIPDGDFKPDPETATGEVITDALNRDRSISLFGGFTRTVEAIGKRLEDSSKNATVLCPENAAIKQLPRKPWEDPADYDTFGVEAYDGDEGKSRADKNLRRFVEAHIVPVSPWKEGEKAMALAGNSVWWESKDGKKIVGDSLSKSNLRLNIRTDPTRWHRGCTQRGPSGQR